MNATFDAYSAKGKQMFPRPGQVVPAGSLVKLHGTCQWTTLPVDHVAVPEAYDASNPYDQTPVRMTSVLVLKPASR